MTAASGVSEAADDGERLEPGALRVRGTAHRGERLTLVQQRLRLVVPVADLAVQASARW
jgi:hypothetical protein